MSEVTKDSNHEKYEVDEATNDPMLSDHDYDGIKELDNDMPTWWRYLFYVSILFSVGYLMRYHVFKSAPLQYEEYLAEFEYEEDTTQVVQSASATPAKPEGEPYTDADNLAAGEKIYQKNCAVCHLSKGEGLVGPNLTDEYWIHGGSYKDIVDIVVVGVPEKGMISWKNQLSAKQIEQVSSYILTLKGTNPPNAKAPQGEKYTPEA